MKLSLFFALLSVASPLLAVGADKPLHYWQCECRDNESPEPACLFPQESCPDSETSLREARAACGKESNIFPNSCVLSEAGPVIIDCNAPNPPPICDRK